MLPTIHTWIHGSFLEHKSLQSEVLFLIDFDHTQVQLSVILLISATHETAIILTTQVQLLFTVFVGF